MALSVGVVINPFAKFVILKPDIETFALVEFVVAIEFNVEFEGRDKPFDTKMRAFTYESVVQSLFDIAALELKQP